MYRFQSLGGDELALRPENTAGVCRAYLQHGLGGQGRIHRLWYIGPMFRYGRPQKGRYRQFGQVGAEIIGTPAPGADVEIITLFVDLFEAWGFKNLAVLVNSVGTPELRRAFEAEFRSRLEGVLDQLTADSRESFKTNPMRILDSKDPKDQERLDRPFSGRSSPSATGTTAKTEEKIKPKMLDFLDEVSRKHFDQVLAGLTASGISY